MESKGQHQKAKVMNRELLRYESGYIGNGVMKSLVRQGLIPIILRQKCLVSSLVGIINTVFCCELQPSPDGFAQYSSWATIQLSRRQGASTLTFVSFLDVSLNMGILKTAIRGQQLGIQLDCQFGESLFKDFFSICSISLVQFSFVSVRLWRENFPPGMHPVTLQ